MRRHRATAALLLALAVTGCGPKLPGQHATPSRAEVVATLADVIVATPTSDGTPFKENCGVALAMFGGRDGIASLIESQPDSQFPVGGSTAPSAADQAILDRHHVTVEDVKRYGGSKHDLAVLMADSMVTACTSS